MPREEIVRAELEHTPGKYAGYVGKADMLVSMRLHALIFRAGRAYPACALLCAQSKRLHERAWLGALGGRGRARLPEPDEMVAKLRELWAVRKEEGARVLQAAHTWSRLRKLMPKR